MGKEQVIGNDDTPEGRDQAYGLELVRRGYIVLAYDLLGANDRAYPGLQQFSTEPFYETHPHWSARGKDIWDVGRAIDFLQTVEEVDASRIGSIGHSQGGGITIDAMALDPRILAGVSSCGDWPMCFMANPFKRARTGWWIGMPHLRPFCWTGKPMPIDLHEKLALIAPRSVLVVAALNDRCYYDGEPEESRPVLENLASNVTKVFQLHDTEGRCELLLHSEGHGFLTEHRQSAYAFLDGALRP